MGMSFLVDLVCLFFGRCALPRTPSRLFFFLLLLGLPGKCPGSLDQPPLLVTRLLVVLRHFEKLFLFALGSSTPNFDAKTTWQLPEHAARMRPG